MLEIEEYIIDNFDDFAIKRQPHSIVLNHKYSDHIITDYCNIYLNNIHIDINIIYYNVKNLKTNQTMRIPREIHNQDFLTFLKLKLC